MALSRTVRTVRATAAKRPLAPFRATAGGGDPNAFLRMQQQQQQRRQEPQANSDIAVGSKHNSQSGHARRWRRRLALAKQPLEMPLAGGGALWLLDRDPLLHGDGFVLRRAEDEWQWAAQQQQQQQQQQRAPPGARAPLLLPFQRECLALVSVPVGDDETAQLGIVPWQDPRWQQQQRDGEQQLSDADAAMQAFLFGSPLSPPASSPPPASPSPRRTARVRFTCRRCGATTQRPVNPHAWARGTVFATCGGCGVTHKLVDNLKLFHELDGPVFGGPLGGRAPVGGADPADAGLPIVSTDFRQGRWSAAGELGLPLGLRWLVEDDGPDDNNSNGPPNNNNNGPGAARGEA